MLLGLAELACGRSRGLARIPASFGYLVLGLVVLLVADALPTLPWPRSSGAMTLVAAHVLAAYLFSVLLPLAISWVIARSWGHGAMWRRYAITFVWLWVIFALILSVLSDVLRAIGAAPFTLGLLVFHLAGLCYGLWLNWFLIRHGLGASATRAAVALVLITIAPISLGNLRYIVLDQPMVITTFKN